MIVFLYHLNVETFLTHRWRSQQLRIQIFWHYIYKHIKNITSWEPVDIDCDGTEDEEYEWNNDVMKDLESRFEELRQYNKKFNDSLHKDVREETSIFIDSTRHDIEELVPNEIYDKLTILLNNTRKKNWYTER